MATLKDIGAELGLSVATVSRALNGFPEVGTQTRIRVTETATRLGYRPNRIAQRLVSGRSGMVGMIVKIKADMSAEQTFFEMLTGLTAALAARDTDLVLAVDQGDDPVAAYERLLERNMLDGFILNAPVRDDPRVAYLAKRAIPFVMHGLSDAAADYPYYAIDNRDVTCRAVQHLAGLGHRRIAMVNADLRHAHAADRADGFGAAMATFGLDIRSGFIVHGIAGEPDAAAAARDLLAGTAPPTAFVCGTTLMAAGVLRAIKSAGLRVPQDVSIVAHDDALPQMRAVNFDPALTVTRAPLRDACGPLADALVDHLQGVPAADLQIMARADLIVRSSTAVARE